MNDLRSQMAESKEKETGTEPGRPASAIQALKAAGGEGRAGAATDLEPAFGADGETETHELAIATDGGPVVVEIELQPLALRPTLPPSAEETTVVQPAAGFWGHYRLFILTVVLPMLIGSLYLFAVAAPRFASSASFIVRAATPSAPQMGGTGQLGMPGVAASSIAQEETFAINAYLSSRDIADQLSKNNDLRGILSRPEGDFLFRYPTFWLPDHNEFLFQRFQWMVSASVDSDTFISTIEVNAFRPEDAHALATAMLEYAEELVNQMNQRTYDDGLAAANRFVADAQEEFDAIEAELKAYRNDTGSVDPQAVAELKLKVIEGLSTQLAQIQAIIAQQKVLTPTSPNLASLRAQTQSYRDEIEKRKLEIAGSSGSEADKLTTYEELTTTRDIAAKALSLAVAHRDQARQDAESQHLFIQVISRPNLARDYARYPFAALDLVALLVISLIVFQVLRKAGEQAWGGSERVEPRLPPHRLLDDDPNRVVGNRSMLSLM